MVGYIIACDEETIRSVKSFMAYLFDAGLGRKAIVS